MSAIWRVASSLGVLASTLSVVTLMILAFRLGLAEPLKLMLQFYHTIVDFCLGWASPILNGLVVDINKQFGLDLHLYDHWKHIFVLMSLYFSADTRANLMLRRYGFAAFSVLWGVTIAVVASVAAGLRPLEEDSPLLIMLPIAGLVIWEIGRSAWSATFSISTPSWNADGKTWSEIFLYCQVTFGLPIVVVATAVLGLAWSFGSLLAQNGRPSNLILLGVFVLLLATVWIGRGAWLATFDRHDGESWNGRFLRSGSTWLGIFVFVTVIGTLLFVAVNAGLNSG